MKVVTEVSRIGLNLTMLSMAGFVALSGVVAINIADCCDRVSEFVLDTKCVVMP